MWWRDGCRQQIPFGNDRKKGKGKGNSNSKGKGNSNGKGNSQNAGISPLRCAKNAQPLTWLLNLKVLQFPM